MRRQRSLCRPRGGPACYRGGGQAQGDVGQGGRGVEQEAGPPGVGPQGLVQRAELQTNTGGVERYEHKGAPVSH